MLIETQTEQSQKEMLKEHRRTENLATESAILNQGFCPNCGCLCCDEELCIATEPTPEGS